jgi:hypothetical protein
VKKVVIACEMLRDELTKAMSLLGSDMPIVWIDTKYHNKPSDLHAKLQEEVDKLKDMDEILFTFGTCGNAILHIQATTADLVIPITEDCISMLLSKPNEKFKRMKNTYFLTKAWMNTSDSLVSDFNRAVERYGKERTDRLFKKMLQNYDKLMLIDTGTYDVQEYSLKAEDFARLANLSLFVENGSIWMLEKLISGPYDDDFCLVPKGESVTFECMGFSEETPPSVLNAY